MTPSLKDYFSDASGSVSPMTVIALIVSIAAGALGIDYARLTVQQQSLAIAADSAALAAASYLPDADSARQAALDYVEKNMPSAKHGNVLLPEDVQVGFWDRQARSFTSIADGATGQNAVRVVTKLESERGNPANLMFAAIFGRDSADVSAVAVAGRGGPPCVIALDPTQASAMSLSLAASVDAVGCGVQVNSTTSPALSLTGLADLRADDICVGGASLVDLTSNSDPHPKDYCPGESDPLADINPPSYGGCDYFSTVAVLPLQTISPGVYCGGLTVAQNVKVNLTPGTYVIKDGPLVLSGGAELSGTGVTFYLTGSAAVVNFLALSKLDLKAPVSGANAGVLFFQDRAYGGIHTWLGATAAHLQGVIYFPNGSLVSQNDAVITPEGSCTVLIAKSLNFSVASGVTVDVSGSDCRAGLPGPYRRGVTLFR